MIKTTNAAITVFISGYGNASGVAFDLDEPAPPRHIPATGCSRDRGRRLSFPAFVSMRISNRLILKLLSMSTFKGVCAHMSQIGLKSFTVVFGLALLMASRRLSFIKCFTVAASNVDPILSIPFLSCCIFIAIGLNLDCPRYKR